MNDMPTEAGSALLVLPVAGLPTILAADDKDILKNLLKELDGWEPDVSTERGRREIASKAQKVRVAKADFGRLADRLKEDAIKTQRAVNGEVKILVERMDALIERVREPLTAFENKEKQRVADHECALNLIENWVIFPGEWSAEQIAEHLTNLEAHELLRRDWQEFGRRATDTIEGARNALHRLHAAAVKQEAEAAEFARLRAEEAERQRSADIEAQRVREERIATEAAERAKAVAEAKAAREAQEAEERARAALRAQALVAEEERAAALRKEREAAETLARVEREKQAAIEKAERDRLAAIERQRVIEQRERLSAEQAEAAKEAAARQAERDRIAAVEAERKRVAREAAAKKAEDDRRAANEAHRAGINREALADLILALSEVHSGTSEEADKIGRAVIEAVARGQVSHMAIDYAASKTKEGPLL